MSWFKNKNETYDLLNLPDINNDIVGSEFDAICVEGNAFKDMSETEILCLLVLSNK